MLFASVSYFFGESQIFDLVHLQNESLSWLGLQIVLGFLDCTALHDFRVEFEIAHISRKNHIWLFRLHICLYLYLTQFSDLDKFDWNV